MAYVLVSAHFPTLLDKSGAPEHCGSVVLYGSAAACGMGLE